MNRILGTLILIVVGTMLQLVTENTLVVFGVSTVLGLVLFRAKKPTKKAKSPVSKQIMTSQKSKPSTNQGKVFCWKCGAKILSTNAYCDYCGARLNQKPPSSPYYQPADVIIRYNKFKLDNYYGTLSNEKYIKLFNENRFRDERGVTWSIGANTLNWYRVEHGKWVRDEPGTKLQIFKRATV